MMKNNSAGDVPVVAKLPFYQKVLNTFGSSSPSTRKAEEPLASSPFRRGYTRTTPIITRSTPVVVVPSTPTTPVSCQAAHKSAASSIFRSFRRRSLRRSFRRTKSFLVKNPVSPTPNAVVAGKIGIRLKFSALKLRRSFHPITFDLGLLMCVVAAAAATVENNSGGLMDIKNGTTLPGFYYI